MSIHDNRWVVIYKRMCYDSNMQEDASDHARVMRIAAWAWIGYVLALAWLDIFIYAGSPVFRPGPILRDDLRVNILWYHFENGLPALIFLILSYSEWLKKKSGVLIPLMILLVSGIPILTNTLLVPPLPRAPLSNVEGMVLRQLPVLFIGLVLVAWHYNLAAMLLYSLGTNALELLITFGVSQLRDPGLSEAFIFVTIIRTICFMVVGVFINQLINRLRSQQEALLTANARLAHHASTLETLAISRERNRMSRELHDTVVHTLSGLSVQLETAIAYWQVDPQTTEKLLGQSLIAARSGLQETRRALKALRATPLEDLGPVIAIQNLVKKAADRGKLVLDMHLPDPSLTISPDAEQCLYRITQEAVENVVHHANAQRLTVKLAVDGEDIDLIVRDDGIGFHAEKKPTPGHFGLPGMQERAHLVGGKLSINSNPGSGTTVHLTIEGCVQ
ncbi:MAG: sensor histidine kinase [Chloroflexota bacterium]